MSLYRTLSQGEADDSPSASPSEAASVQWRNRYLPPPGSERKAFLFLVALVFILKILTIYHFRADVDETQHAHIVWGWATGRLQYRDLFDNHMPLFQMACAPLMAMLGERADILILLRFAMIPLFLLCLWTVFKLTETLFSRRIAPWVALAAASLPRYFYTSTEFRPDNLWALFWLLALLVAVTGSFTLRRAFAFGLLIGLTFAVSMKTVVLAAALLTATLIALVLACIRREGPGPLQVISRLAAILLAAVIPPAAVVLYFLYQGAFAIMYYCVVSHNIVPRLKRWGHFSIHEYLYPVSLLALGACACLIFSQTRDTRLAMKRTIILLTPWFFLFLLLSYWPDITREDDLPYAPLTPLLAVPLLLWLDARFKIPRLRARFFTWILPMVCFAELIWVWNTNTLRTDRLKVTTQSIRDVLLLTGPNDYVLDRSGDYIFRMRPCYWVFETITKARIRLGLIPDHLASELARTKTKVCYLFAAQVLPKTTLFIMSNYIPFDPAALDLGVAGKELQSFDNNYSFDVAIPQTYAVVSESGATAGALDNAPYLGPIRIAPGHHTFHRTAGSGRLAIFLDAAATAGFHPLFDISERFIKKEQSDKKS